MSTFYNNKEHALSSDLLSMAELGLSDLHEWNVWRNDEIHN